MFPRRQGAALEAVVVNTAGGVTGGDSFALDADLAAGTHMTITTQAAERGYRAVSEQTGRINAHLRLGSNARLHWLPQETILFDGCNLHRDLRIDLAQTAQLLMCEPVVFGRTAMGEEVRCANWRDAITITRDSAPLVMDRTRLDGDLSRQLDRPVIANGARAMATVIYAAPDAQGLLDPARSVIGPVGGASLVHADVLIIRLLAKDGFALRQRLVPLLTRLSGLPLPRPWMI